MIYIMFIFCLNGFDGHGPWVLLLFAVAAAAAAAAAAADFFTTAQLFRIILLPFLYRTNTLKEHTQTTHLSLIFSMSSNTSSSDDDDDDEDDEDNDDDDALIMLKTMMFDDDDDHYGACAVAHSPPPHTCAHAHTLYASSLGAGMGFCLLRCRRNLSIRSISTSSQILTMPAHHPSITYLSPFRIKDFFSFGIFEVMLAGTLKLHKILNQSHLLRILECGRRLHQAPCSY